MNLTGFRIFGLFGTLDHKISLKPGGVTFIHGPNGSGKTTALRLLENILSLNFSDLADVLFKSVEVDFSDASTIVVERSATEPGQHEERKRFADKFPAGEEEDVHEPGFEIFISLRKKNVVTERRRPVIDPGELNSRRAQILSRPSLVEHLVKGTKRMANRAWKLEATGEVVGLAEIADRYAASMIAESLPQWFIERAKATKLNAIRAQRLFEFNESGDGDPEVKQIVSVFSDDVRAKMSQKIAQSALQFQRKEKTFPHRILAGEVVSEKESVLRMNYVNLQRRVSTLEKVGLQESSDSLVLPENSKLNPTHKRVLTLYLSDMNEKLDVFNDLLGQITLMTELLSKKLRRKKFSIHKDHGFRLVAKDEAGTSLKPTDLSSGEQHQLVMLYQLIFSDEPNQLYLIDEPEISLHVEWQRQFSDDLRSIAEARGHRFLIATHSPQIINGRLDLAIPLDGGIVE